MAKREKAQDLPGMEERAIKALQDAATEYAAIRDQRMALNEQESKLKARVRDLMHRHNRTHYAYDGVEIELQPPDGEEKVRVRVAKPKAEEEDA